MSEPTSGGADKGPDKGPPARVWPLPSGSPTLFSQEVGCQQPVPDSTGRLGVGQQEPC